jgi:sorbitol/mannitol transport system permease protein
MTVTSAPARTAAPVAANRQPRRFKPGKVGLAVLAWALGIFFFFPVLWMFLTGFKTEAQAASNPPTWTFTPTLANYQHILERDFLPFLINSCYAAIGSTLLVVLLAVPAAYALSIAPVPKWQDSLFFFMSTRMMPAVASIIPLYVIFKNLGLLDNINVLTVIYTVMNLPIAVWMIRSFLLEIPKEVLEAARLDGASTSIELRKIVLPMIGPGLAATALICFIFAWNEFFFVLNLTNTQAPTVPIFLTGFIAGEGLFWAQLSAASTLAVLPVILAGWIAQKWLVRGLSLGAVK